MSNVGKTEQERFTDALRVHHDVYSLDPDIDVVGQFKEILDSSILGDPIIGVKSKMQSDEDYANTWFVNLHNLVRDSQGMLNSQITDNVVEFMRNTFEVDINPETQRINDTKNDFCVGDFFVEDYKTHHLEKDHWLILGRINHIVSSMICAKKFVKCNKKS